MDIKINITGTACAPRLASAVADAPRVNSVLIAPAAAIGGGVSTDTEFATRSGPPLWSPPV